MTRPHWLLFLSSAWSIVLLSGCLRGTTDLRDDPPSVAGAERTGPTCPQVLSPYLPSAPPTEVRASLIRVKPVDLRIGQPDPPPPARPPDPPPAPMQVQAAPRAAPEAPLVAALRGLLDRHSREEVREQLQSRDPATRELILNLLENAAHLDKCGLERASPREIGALVDRLNALAMTLRPRAQLTLDKVCFCQWIKSFGQFKPLPPDHGFQPGEEADVYVQVRNFTSRAAGREYETVVKGRLEIYDDRDRRTPVYFWDSEPCRDRSQALRQDYFLQFHFHVPLNWPPGTYTLWVQVEDQTPSSSGEKPKARLARRSLDFKVVSDAASSRSRAGGADMTLGH